MPHRSGAPSHRTVGPGEANLSSPGAVRASDAAALDPKLPQPLLGRFAGAARRTQRSAGARGRAGLPTSPPRSPTWDRVSSPLQRRLSPQIPTCSRTRSSPTPYVCVCTEAASQGLTDETRLLADGTQPPARPVPKVRGWDRRVGASNHGIGSLTTRPSLPGFPKVSVNTTEDTFVTLITETLQTSYKSQHHRNQSRELWSLKIPEDMRACDLSDRGSPEERNK